MRRRQGDTLDEDDETFTLGLSNPVNATIADGRARHVSDDDPLPLLSVADASVAEGDAGTATLVFTASLSAASVEGGLLRLGDHAGDGDGRYGLRHGGGGGTIPAGDSTTFDVTVNGDTLDEEDETLTVTLSNPANATLDDGTGRDDRRRRPARRGLDVATRRSPKATPAPRTSRSTSRSPRRARRRHGRVGDRGRPRVGAVRLRGRRRHRDLRPGDTAESVSVTINGDGVAELDEEFHVVLSAPSNATLGDASATGTIVDDELMPVLDIDEPSIAEGQSGTTTLTFSVTLSHPRRSP